MKNRNRIDRNSEGLPIVHAFPCLPADPGYLSTAHCTVQLQVPASRSGISPTSRVHGTVTGAGHHSVPQRSHSILGSRRRATRGGPARVESMPNCKSHWRYLLLRQQHPQIRQNRSAAQIASINSPILYSLICSTPTAPNRNVSGRAAVARLVVMAKAGQFRVRLAL